MTIETPFGAIDKAGFSELEESFDTDRLTEILNKLNELESDIQEFKDDVDVLHHMSDVLFNYELESEEERSKALQESGEAEDEFDDISVFIDYIRDKSSEYLETFLELYNISEELSALMPGSEEEVEEEEETDDIQLVNA